MFSFYPSDAISAGIATAIKPTAAVAVSNEVLTALKKFNLLYIINLLPFVSFITINRFLCTLLQSVKDIKF